MAMSPLFWVPEAQVFTLPAEDAYLPLLCRTQLTQSPLRSFSAEFLALVVYGLESCHTHLNTCHFNRTFS